MQFLCPHRVYDVPWLSTVPGSPFAPASPEGPGSPGTPASPLGPGLLSNPSAPSSPGSPFKPGLPAGPCIPGVPSSLSRIINRKKSLESLQKFSSHQHVTSGSLLPGDIYILTFVA